MPYLTVLRIKLIVLAGRGANKNIKGCQSIEQLCMSLERPRKVMILIKAGRAIAGLQERDVMIVVDTDPKAQSILRKTLHPKGFNWVLISKDGRIKLRKPFAWDMRELSRVIDKMPIRQREMSKP